MSQGATVFFNFISLIFLGLTILIAVIVFSVASGSMDPPFLAPETPGPTATQFTLPEDELTLTPAGDSAETPAPDQTGTPAPDDTSQ
jgi:hypothetical protein